METKYFHLLASSTNFTSILADQGSLSWNSPRGVRLIDISLKINEHINSLVLSALQISVNESVSILIGCFRKLCKKSGPISDPRTFGSPVFIYTRNSRTK